jgi:hypothetical protein
MVSSECDLTNLVRQFNLMHVLHVKANIDSKSCKHKHTHTHTQKATQHESKRIGSDSHFKNQILLLIEYHVTYQKGPSERKIRDKLKGKKSL